MTVHLTHPDGLLQQTDDAPVAVATADLWAGTARAQQSEGFTSPLPPITVIGVQALWVPALLVEIEATAVMP